jgi:hypothetical protein
MGRDMQPETSSLIYFARGVDDLDAAASDAVAAQVRAELAVHGLRMVDPVQRERLAGVRHGDYRAVVELDLSLLRRCDAVLMDMTIPQRNYIGCSAELVYSRLWRIPAVVYVGSTGYERRPWLQYHAAQIVRDRTEAVRWLAGLFTGGVAGPPG